MDATHIFEQLVAQRGKALARSYAQHPAYDELIKAGLIAETGVVSSVVCDDCDRPHDAAIIYQDAQYGYFCPDLGFRPAERAEITSVEPKIAAFVAQIAENQDCKRRKSTALNGETWRIGVLETAAGDVAFYFQPTMLDAKDVEAVGRAFNGEIKSAFGIILTSAGALSVPPYITVPLRDALCFAPETGSFIVDADVRSIAGVPVKRTGGRPSGYKDPLRRLIANRVNDGIALKGQNEEARAIRAAYKTSFPHEKAPSISTIKRYLSKD